jgi:hypothetical protein
MPITNTNRYPFNSTYVNESPEYAGVYSLWLGNEIIYYGRAMGGFTTIRSRLQSHLRGDEGRCTQQAIQYSWEVCNNPAQRELELLREYQVHFGRFPRCNERFG